ncbi:hypothetical protein LguiB_005116 [Lonicera macranthoides]
MLNTELGIMDCNTLSSSCQLEDKGCEKISISDEISRLQHSTLKSDSFIVDMERFSHVTTKDVNPNSRITRNLSRKGSQRGGEKKMNSSIENERDPSHVNPTSSPRATATAAASLLGTSTPAEKPMLVTVGATINPKLHHHQITISTGKDSTGTTTPTAESRYYATKRLICFKRPSPCRTIDPRRLLFIFATLSSMGTILLIYFTLSMGKFNGDESGLNS